MTEPRIVLDRGQAAALLWLHDRNRRPAVRCATCDEVRDARGADRDAGFCGSCLDRSRIAGDDDVGGES